jgi:adenine-specific DNA-methyltransferase
MKPCHIRAVRAALRETQAEFAARFGVSQIAVAHWESGRSKPSAERQLVLAGLQSVGATVQERGPTTPFRPIQYLGSKLRLAHSIAAVVNEVSTHENPRVADLFAGSGVVSHTLASTRPVTAVDIQAYSSALAHGLLKTSCENFFSLGSENFGAEAIAQSKKIINIFAPLIDLEQEALEKVVAGEIELLNEIIEFGSLSAFLQRPSSKYPERLRKALIAVEQNIKSSPVARQGNLAASCYFGGAYFSYQQAVNLDAIYLAARELAPDAKAAAIAVILSTASEIVNTVGKQFAQPIKLKKPDGSTPKILVERTVRDRGLDTHSVFRAMALRWAGAVNSNLPTRHNYECVDVLDFVERDQSCGSFYADPPYTIDHYSRFYHVLETLVLRDQPNLDEMVKGGTPTIMRGIYRRGRHQSLFSIPSTAANAFERLFSAVGRKQAPLILSYSPFDKAAGHRPRLLALDHLTSLAKNYFSSIEIIEVSEHSHRRLTAKALNVPLKKDAERLIICR